MHNSLADTVLAIEERVRGRERREEEKKRKEDEVKLTFDHICYRLAGHVQQSLDVQVVSSLPPGGKIIIVAP